MAAGKRLGDALAVAVLVVTLGACAVVAIVVLPAMLCSIAIAVGVVWAANRLFRT